MRKSTIIKICILILMGIFFVEIDKKCQNYGVSATLFEKTFPANLKPCFMDYAPLHFVFLDKDGFERIGKGFKYENIPFTIDSIISYGYINDSSVLVKCIGSDEKIHAIELFSSGHVCESKNKIKISSVYNLDIDNIWYIRAFKENLILLFIFCCIYIIKNTNWMRVLILAHIVYICFNFIFINGSAIKELLGV